jgi:hypothetical protein
MYFVELQSRIRSIIGLSAWEQGCVVCIPAWVKGCACRLEYGKGDGNGDG